MTSWRPQGPWAWPAIAAVFVLVLIAGSSADAATRIVPLGDSLTKSMVDTDDGDVHPSFRYWLWEKLADNGYDVDFVGSSTSPRFEGYDFDRGNEGHGGYRIGDIVDGVDGEGRLSSWLKGYKPDIALVLIGTNDVLWDTPMDERFSGLDQIVETLRDRNPEVAIFVGKLPPTGDPVRNEEQGLLEFNGRLPGWASDESTPDSPVRVVDLYSGYDGRDDNQEPRYLHPDESGERKIANRWYSAIRDYVDGGDGEETPTITATTTATATPTLTESPTATQTTPPGATYDAARAGYVSAAGAWSRAWGASDMVLIRQYLNQAKDAYSTCLDTANQAVDPANAANLAVIRPVSDAYVDLADAALAMYDGADLFGAGRDQMNAGTYAAAAASFGSAAEKFTSSQTLFTGATITLQGVSYAGTEYGDGTAYTAMIVPLLNGKAAYMGEYAAYARGWQHAALAYQAGAGGDAATFRNEATQAMNLFAGLQMSPNFGADAISNHNILAGLLGGSTGPTIAPTVAPLWTAGEANPTPWGLGPRRPAGWTIATAA